MRADALTMSLLYDYYGELLTEKQRQLFDLYYDQDYSLSEIAAAAGISRQGVHDTLARAEELLEGYERTLGYLRQNTICCMDALRHDAGVSVTITALTTLRAVPLTLADMSRLMGLSSAFAEDVMVYYSDVLKLMCLDAESQSSNSVLNKLANFIGLYVLSEDYARFGFLPFSQQELASAIGASRVQVARVCEKLKAQGIVDIKKRRLYVLDRAALAEMASLEVSS